MKKFLSVIIFLFLVFISSNTAYNQHSGIQFSSGPLSDIQNLAKTKNKFIFIDCYTTWCGPCKWMEKNVFTDIGVGNFFNENFISIQVDMEKGEGINIAKKYGIKCYPTLLFIDYSGAVVYKVSGALDIKQFVDLGNVVLNLEEPFYKCEEKYLSGTANSNDFINYIKIQKGTCNQVDSLIKAYEETQHEIDYSNRSNWMILQELVESADSKLFKYMVANRSMYDAKYSADSVNRVMIKVYETALINYLWINEPDYEGFKKMREKIEKVNQPVTDKIVARMNIFFYEQQKDWDNYAKATIYFFDNFPEKEDYNFLNNCAWTFYEHIDDTGSLEKALSWIKTSVEIKSEYFNLDTYAALLYKLGKYDDALVRCKEAISDAQKNNIDYSETTKLQGLIEAKLKK